MLLHPHSCFLFFAESGIPVYRRQCKKYHQHAKMMWLPGARVHLFKLSHSRCMGVHTTIYIDNLTGDISAFVRAEEYAHMADIFWTTVAVYHDIAQENVFQHLWNFSFVVWCYNQTRTHTIATNVIFAVLQWVSMSTPALAQA